VKVADGSDVVGDDEERLVGDAREQAVAGGPPGGPCELATETRAAMQKQPAAITTSLYAERRLV